MASIARTSTGLEGAILIHPDGTVVTGTGTGGGGSTTVWSAADAAANGMTLSNGGLTVTQPARWSLAERYEKRSAIHRVKLYIEFLASATGYDAVMLSVGLASPVSIQPVSNLVSSSYSVGVFRRLTWPNQCRIYS